jgi:integrase
MGRTQTNAVVSLINRTNRAKLPAQHDPYWHLIAEGQHLGYRKSPSGPAKWIARYYVTEGAKRVYRFQTLGAVDDAISANGTHVLSFSQAVEQAQKWFNARNVAQASGVTIGPYLVSDAAAAWMASRECSDASKRNSESNLKYHILPTLGHIDVRKMTKHQIQSWLKELPNKAPVKVQQRAALTKKLSPSRQSKVVFDPSDPETKRRRQDTANRIFNDLSALLNYAYSNGRAENKSVWETVEKFENVSVAKNEYLTLDEANRFIAACPPDFRDLVQGALITGCRYGELTGLKVGAYDVQLRAVSLIQGKTGKLKHVFLTDDEAGFFAKRAAGKGKTELMFRRDDGEAWGKSHQQPRMKAVLKAAGIKRHVRFHDLRHTFATLLAMNGTSVQLIADQLGHSGTRIAEKHYAHFSPSYVATTIRANKPSFGFATA